MEHTGECWPEVVAVVAKRSLKIDREPLFPARVVSSLLYGTRVTCKF